MDKTMTSVRLAGRASIFLGLSYLAVGLGYILMPVEQRDGNIHEMLVSMQETTLGFSLLNWAIALGGLAALAAVPAIADLGSRAWSGWARSLGMLGFAVASVNSFRLLQLVRDEAFDYARVPDDAARYAIRSDNLHLSLDRNGWIIYGAVGLFILITAVGALRRRSIPAPLAWIGVAGAVFYFLVVAGNLLGESMLVAIAAVAGGIVVAPIFYIWVGRLLLADHNVNSEKALPEQVRS